MDTTQHIIPAPPGLAARFLEPAGFRWGYMEAADGAHLRWGHLPATAPGQKTCILLGGFREFVEKYFETARDFQSRGYDVWCMDWRGQGRSVRGNNKRAAARDFHQDADDLTSFIARMVPSRSRCLLVAHSMGAAIALLSLHAQPDLVDAAVLSAPMLRLDTGPAPHWAARWFAWLMNACGLGDRLVPGIERWSATDVVNPAASRVSHDPDRCLVQHTWFGACPELILDGPTYAWANAAFSLTARLRSAAILSTIRTPILIGSAGKERRVDPAAHRRAAALLPHAELVEFPDAKHELFNETDLIRNGWLAAIDGFAAAALAVAPR